MAAMISAKAIGSDAGLSTGNFSTTGFLLGGTLGINYLTGSGFLFGVEGDFDWSTLLGQSSTGACAALPLASFPLAQRAQRRASGSARRGAAQAMCSIAFLFSQPPARPSPISRLASYPPGNYQAVGPQLGWTAGGGVEYAFSDSWTAKLEYLYADLGDVTYSSTGNCVSTATATVTLKRKTLSAAASTTNSPGYWIGG